MEFFAHDVLGETSKMAAEAGQKKRDLIVVTLVSGSLDPSTGSCSTRQDQRNHGERIHDRNANLAYDKNERHL